MKNLEEAVGQVVSMPTPSGLVDLQGAILASGLKGREVEQALDVAGHFYAYLSELQSKLSARNYSDLASRLDLGAMGAVALESLLAGEGGDLWQRLMLGGLSETLMVAASRQYIKGWEVESDLVHRQAAWYLAEALWRASPAMEDNSGAEARWQVISSLLAPARAADVGPAAKAVLLGRVFQILLLILLAGLPETGQDQPGSGTEATTA